jgi:hypothetical protein
MPVCVSITPTTGCKMPSAHQPHTILTLGLALGCVAIATAFTSLNTPMATFQSQDGTISLQQATPIP